MSRPLRVALWIVVTLQALVALGFAFAVPAAVDLMPFAERSQLTNVFIGSIFAAAAASTAWCLLADSLRALAGIALDYLVILGPLALYAFVQAARGEEPRTHLAVFGATCLAGALVGLALLRKSLRAPWRDPRPTPAPVRVSFAVFLAALVVVSSLLVARVQVLPWRVTDELSLVIGLMFLGAAAYFVYGFARPRWENAGGQLAGFLAYDAVLIVPFLKRLPDVPDEFRVGLIVYTAVLVYSGALAVWYLALSPRTRGRAERAPEGAALPTEAGA